MQPFRLLLIEIAQAVGERGLRGESIGELLGLARDARTHLAVGQEKRRAKDNYDSD